MLINILTKRHLIMIITRLIYITIIVNKITAK
jgi:hypothetical protein